MISYTTNRPSNCLFTQLGYIIYFRPVLMNIYLEKNGGEKERKHLLEYILYVFCKRKEKKRNDRIR